MAYTRQGAINLYVGLAADVLPTGVPEGSEAHAIDTDTWYKTADGTNWSTLTGLASLATAAELAKVPKSDSNVTWNATALGDINAQVDGALNTIVPASPTAGSLNDILSKASGGNTFNKATDSLEAIRDAMALDSTVAKDATVAKTTELLSAGTNDFNATAKASINTEVDGALNTIVPASPTAGSLNDILSKAAPGNTFNKATDSLEALADAIALIPTAPALASSWTAALATALGNYTAARAGYLDELDFDLNARLGTPAGASLSADLLTIDNLVDDLEGAVGAIEGATTLHNKLTAARAALLDQITALRLAELDAANLPADIDTIKGLVDSAETTGPYAYTDAGGEQDVVADTATTRRRIRVEFSNRNMTQTGTFRIYRKVDGTNYDLYLSQQTLVAAGSDRAFDAEFTTNQHWKLTYQEDSDEGAERSIPFNVITEVIE